MTTADNEPRVPRPSHDRGHDARLAVETMLTGTDALRTMLGRIPGSGRVWNVAVGAGLLFGDGVAGAARRIRPVLGPAVRVILHPPLLARRYHPGEWLDDAARRAAEARLGDIDRVIDALIPAVVERVLDAIDLPEIVRESTGTMASETVRDMPPPHTTDGEPGPPFPNGTPLVPPPPATE